jgi:hypothetical protein
MRSPTMSPFGIVMLLACAADTDAIALARSRSHRDHTRHEHLQTARRDDGKIYFCPPPVSPMLGPSHAYLQFAAAAHWRKIEAIFIIDWLE